MIDSQYICSGCGGKGFHFKKVCKVCDGSGLKLSKLPLDSYRYAPGVGSAITMETSRMGGPRMGSVDGSRMDRSRMGDRAGRSRIAGAGMGGQYNVKGDLN